VLALATGLFYLHGAPRYSTPIRRLFDPGGFALLGLPILVFVGLGCTWAVQGRWRRIGLLLAGSVLVTLPLAAFSLWADGRFLGPTQHYVADGWYGAWLMGAYVTGVLLVLGW